ncbi:MAG: hypothetical protein HUJ91_05750, partial [Bacteroidales bacterium]|nr:hypothetical protein [Bacteroidales bacterium]
MESLERKIGFDIVRNITKGKCATASAVRLVEELPIMTDAEAIVKAL